VSVTDVPEFAFRVLAGMLAYHNGVVQPISAARALLGAADLLTTTEQPPALTSPPPYPGDFEPGETLTPQLNVSIEFGGPPDAERIEQLEAELGVWHALMQGGYPAPDYALGESGTSPPSIRRLDPYTLRYSVEMWRTGHDAFVPLYNLVRRWDKIGPRIVEVSITA
jgi:hypothetical protein